MRIAQKERNERIIALTLSQEERKSRPDRIRITGRMTCLGRDYPVLEEEYPLAEKSPVDGGEEILFSVPYFGTVRITATLYRGEETLARREEKIHVAADEYFIAPLIATMPVLIFALKYFSDLPRTGEGGSPIPTILTSSRCQDLTREELPEHMYLNPYLGAEDWPPQGGDLLKEQLPKLRQYLRELRRGNPDARFTFFFNDSHLEWLIPKLYWSIPKKKRRLRLITDGGRTWFFFRKFFDSPCKPNKVLRRQSEILAITHILSPAHFFPFIRRYPTWQISYFIGHLIQYVEAPAWPLTLREPDAKWWVMSRERFQANDLRFLKKFQESEGVEEIDIPELYRKAEEKGNLPELFCLLRYDDRLIREIEEEGKVPVLAQGGNKVNHENFPKYLRKLREQLGEEYDLLVKSHPGATEEARTLIEDAETDGTFKMLYSEAPAELFLLRHPKMLLAGYPSTTFSTSVCPDRHLALFDMSREEAMNDPLTRGYAPTVRWFIPSPDGEIEETDPFAVAAAGEDTLPPAR